MKKSKKLLSLVMGATMLTTSLLAGGCGKGSIYTEGAEEGRPNYDISENAETFKIWSYGQTCDDHYYIASEPIYFLDENGNRKSMMDESRIEELIEANFTVVFIDYSHGGEGLFTTEEEWEQKPQKRTLDLCQQYGLKAFTHGGYLNPASRGHEMIDEDGNYYTSRINPGKYNEQYNDLYKSDAATERGLIVDKYTTAEEESGAIRATVIDELVDTAMLNSVTEYYTEIATEQAEDQTFADDAEKTAWIEAKVAELAPNLATEYEELFVELIVKAYAQESLWESLTAKAEEDETLADDDAKLAWVEAEFARITNDEAEFAVIVEAQLQTMIDELIQYSASEINSKVSAQIAAIAQEEFDETIEGILERRLWSGAQKKFYKDEDQYVRYAAETMNHVINHPAFYGASAIDEPPYQTFPLAAEAMRIWQKAANDIYGKDFYCMFNMLPAADTPGVKGSYCENGSNMDVWSAYEAFLQHYKEAFVDTGVLDYIQYDDYPIYTTGLRDTYLRCHQLTSEFARDNNIKSVIAMQSYGSDGAHRVNEAEDALWQAHISMAFGKTEFSYYTYWPVLNTTDGLLEDRTYPLTRFGERTPAWYSVQKANAELIYNGKYLLHFEYKDSTYLNKTPMPTGISCLNGLKRPTEYTKLGEVVIDEPSLYFKGQAGGGIIVTELYDEENDQLGYYVVNITDPIVDSEASVTLSFPNFNNIQIVQNMTTSNVALADHTFTFELGTGRGAFIMPY